MKTLREIEYSNHIIRVAQPPNKNFGLYIEIEELNVFEEEDFVPDAWSIDFQTDDVEEAVERAKISIDIPF